MNASELLPFDVSTFLGELRRAGCSLGEPFHYFTTTTSTNDEAKRLAHARAPHGTTCVADFQTNGRGRQGKSWYAQPNAQVLTSVLLRQPHLTNNATITLAVGVALHRALQSVLPNESSLAIKWPNDIEVRDRKLAGILAESHVDSDGEVATIIGFGVNVWEPPMGGDEPIQPVALRTLSSYISREQLLVHLLQAVEEALLLFHRSGLEPFVQYLNQYNALSGETVSVDGLEGRVVKVSANGGLVLDTAKGQREVYSGTLERHPKGARKQSKSPME